MTLTTSVVICAYTEARWEQLCQAVSSVQAQRRPVDEIIVVIDHNDALLARAQVAFATTTVLANAAAQGLSGARNTGIDASTGDIVCFLDDDAAAEEDWSTHLLAPYADPNILGVGGAATPAWETAEPSWWPGEFGWVVGCSYRGQPTTTSPVRNLMGCNMSLRRTVLDGGRWLRHRAGSPRRQPARLRGDRALHPGGTAVSRWRLPARAGSRRAPPRTRPAGVLALLPGPLPGRRHLQGGGRPPGGSLGRVGQ